MFRSKTYTILLLSWLISTQVFAGEFVPPPGNTFLASPVANNDTLCAIGLSTFKFDILGNDIDLDGDPLTFMVLDSLQNGSGTNVLDTLKFAPSGFVGLDSLRYMACDTTGLCDTAWVFIRTLPIPDAGIDSSICGTSYTLQANDLSPATGTWSSFPFAPTFSNDNDPLATVTGLSPGVNNFHWIISYPGCALQFSSIALTVNAIPTANFINNDTVCKADTARLDINFTGNSNFRIFYNDGTSNYTVTSIPGPSYTLLVAPHTNTTYEIDSVLDQFCMNNGLFGTSTAAVLVYQLPSSGLPNDTSFCKYDSLILTANPADQYLWSTTDTVGNTVITAAAKYWVYLNDSNNCADTDSVIVTLDSLPSIIIAPDSLALCPGDTQILDPGIWTAYNWSSGQSTQSVNIGTTGTYFVEVTDSMGCKGSDTTYLSFIPLSVSLGNDSAICDGDSVLLNSGWGGGATFSWNTGDTTQSIWAKNSGQYVVNVTSSCVGTDTFSLSLNPRPSFSLGTDTILCAGQVMILDPGNSWNQYLWSTGATANTFVVSNTGTYWAEVWDSNGCMNRNYITIGFSNAPSVNLGVDTFYCEGTKITLDAGVTGTSYTWNTGENSALITVDSTGNYKVFANNLCGTTIDSVQINFVAAPYISLGNDTTICEGGNLPLNAFTNGGMYNWSTGSNGSAIFVNSDGAYFVQVTSPPGCVVNDTIIVTTYKMNTSFSGLDNSYCVTSPVVLLAGSPNGGAFTGSGISGNSFNPSFSGTGAVDITYTYFDVNGCDFSTLIQTNVYDTIPANAGLDQDIYFTPQTQLQAISPISGQGQWAYDGPGNISISGGANALVSGFHEGSYTFTWTVTNGPCKRSDDVIIQQHHYHPERGFSPNGDGLNDTFIITGLENYPESHLRVFTRWGTMVYESKDYENDWNGESKFGEFLPDDTYSYILTLNTGEAIQGYVLINR